MKKFCFVLLVCCLFGTNALADVSRGQCVADASKARRDAVAAAKEAFEIARISCQGPCHEACVNAHATCVGPFREAEEQCSSAAQQAFASAREACRTSTNCGELKACYANVAFQQCLVQPRVDRRIALRACATTRKAGIKAAACHSTLKACRKTCRKSDADKR